MSFINKCVVSLVREIWIVTIWTSRPPSLESSISKTNGINFCASQFSTFLQIVYLLNKEFLQLTNQKLEISKLILKKNEQQNNMD